MKRINLTLLVVVVAALFLTGCNNPRAERPGVFYLPWTWGDKTLKQSLEEGCRGGAISTVIDGSTYPCPGYEHPSAPASQPIKVTTPAQSECPTTQEVKNLTGVDVQRIETEPCAFVWRGSDKATTMATCPSGWVCTWDVVGNIVVVHLGVNQTATIRAGTWRLIDAYPTNDAVHNVCSLYDKERKFGLSEVPSFQVRFQPVTDDSGSPVGPQSCP